MSYRYYIGMDAHSKTSTFAVMNRKGKVVKKVSVATTEAEVLKLLCSVNGPKALTFEETTISQWLYVLLKSEVDHLVVCDPAANFKKGAKTDKIDAVELADLLRVGRLMPVFHTNDERIELRTLISGYEDLNKEIVRTKNRYKALFRLSATLVRGSRVYSDPKMIQKLSTKTQKFVAKPLFYQLAILDQHKELYQKKFKQNFRRYKEMRLIKSIPGFGETNTNQIVGLVVSPWRFATKYKFFSYAMLVKHKQISDGVSYGQKRVYGQSQLKAIFRMAALAAMKSDNAFKRKYQQMILNGGNQKAAFNAVSRSLAATVLGIWKSGKKYDDHYQEVKLRKKGCSKRT